MMKKAVFPGTFDPPTLGHWDIIKRSSHVFSKVYILVAINDQKKPFLKEEERVFLLEELVKSLSNVEVILWDGLIIDFIKKEPSFTIIRGVRSLQDFPTEWDMFLINSHLSSYQIDTFWLPCCKEYIGISSTLVKSLLSFNQSILGFVPPFIAKYLEERNTLQEGIALDMRSK